MSTAATEDRVERLGDAALPGIFTTSRRQRLTELLAEEPDPGPIEIYRHWIGSTPDTGEAAASRSAHATASTSSASFDPAEDDAHNRTRVEVRGTYNRALEAGMEDAAEYLRELSHDHQIQFAQFLRREYLEG